MTQRVAVLGLGTLGLPIALRLARSGFRVTGYDPEPERSALLAAPAVAASSASAAVAGAHAALVVVADAVQAQSALFGPSGVVAGAEPGTPVVLISTLGIDSAAALARRLERYRLPTLDAPVTGGALRAGSGELVVMAGGHAEVLRQVSPILRALAVDIVHCGPHVGSGQALKTVNQLLCAINIAATAEALALAESMELDGELVIRALRQGAAQSFVFDDHAPRMLSDDGRLLAAIGLIAKDIDLVLAESARRGVHCDLGRCVQDLYADAVASGYARADTSRMFEFTARRRKDSAPDRQPT
jgi:3-hydroxyisobutyrate dehydrogenase